MQHVSTNQTHQQSRGGRVATARHLELQQQSEDFTGLEDKVGRYDLLLLVKKVGKDAGFTSSMIELLDYYINFTRDQDWEEGARPIVYASLARTALDFGVSERQIQRLERSLSEVGALTWRDSGNHRRYGQRCPQSGRILYAFGVDLTPLAYLRAELQEKLDEKELRDKAWMETKRQISWYRAQIRGLIAADPAGGGQSDYDDIAVPIRTYLSLEALRALLEKHKTLYDELLEAVQTEEENLSMSRKASSTDDTDVAYNKYSTQEPLDESTDSSPAGRCLQEGVGRISVTQSDPVREEGPETDQSAPQAHRAAAPSRVSLKQVLNAATARFKDCIPMEPRPMNWGDVVEAAYRLRPELHISQQSWGEGCARLGRVETALCLLLTDRAVQREKDPVLKPAAYFRALIVRAEKGELKLHASIMAALKAEEGSSK